MQAAFPDMERARQAIDALERAGIDGAKIDLSGRPAREAIADTETRRPDVRVTRLVGRRAALGALIGSAVGAVAGLLIGLMLSSRTGMLAAIIGGVVALGAVGGVVGGVSSVDMSRGWELAQHPVHEGQVLIRVKTGDPDELSRAEEALRGENPLRLDR